MTETTTVKDSTKSPPKYAPIDFGTLEEIEIPVKIKGKDGKVREYILREASGEAVVQYRNAMFQRTTLGPEGKPTKLQGFGDVEPLLVSLCLFETTANGTERNVPVTVVKAFPGRVQKKLYETALDISDLREEDTIAELEKRLLEAKKKQAEREQAEGNFDDSTETGSS